MRARWRIMLIGWGLFLFGVGTWSSLKFDRDLHKNHPARYFWWGSFRLDSDPLNKHPLAGTQSSCHDGQPNCIEWDPEMVWVDPGLFEQAFVLTALPALFVGLRIVHGLAHLGVSEVVTFMISMPLLISAWFYFVGWLLDRWRYKCRLARENLTT